MQAFPRTWWQRVAAVVAAVAALSLAGCGQLEDQARQAVDDVANEASSELEQAVRDQVDRALERFGGEIDVDRICELVDDERLTGGERGRLTLAVEVGEALGLPQQVVRAGQHVLDTTDGATDQVQELSTACRRAGATPSTRAT